MGMGAAIGGVASIMGGLGAAGAAADAAGMAEEWMDKAWNIGEESVDLADSFREAMGIIAEEYGEYAQNVWQDWETMYGPIEKNLVNYYSNLDPDKYATQWKAAIEQNMNKQFKQFEQAAAQTGLMTTGMSMQAKQDQSYKQAMANAQAEMMAPEKVAQMQGDFYGKFGAPQKATAQNLLGQSILNEANLMNMGLQPQLSTRNQLMNQANQNMQAYMQSSAGYGSASGNLLGQGLNLLGGLF